MLTETSNARAGRKDDADAMVELINYAGEGLPVFLWRRMTEPGQSVWDVGRARARRETGGFSYRNARMIDVDGAAAACLIGYPLPKTPAPIPADMPAMFLPLQELENLAPGSWYVNVLATMPGHRGRGLGAALLAEAERIAHAAGCREMSIMVSDANHGARRLYERCGYGFRAERPMVKEDWINDGQRWVLLTKRLPARADHASQPPKRTDNRTDHAPLGTGASSALTAAEKT